MREPTRAEIQRACDAFGPITVPLHRARMADALRAAFNPPPEAIVSEAEALARAGAAETSTLKALKEL